MIHFVVHAAKIPEGVQGRSKDQRMLAGDLQYVNACDDRPWRRLPDGQLTAATPCKVCQRIIEYQPRRTR